MAEPNGSNAASIISALAALVSALAWPSLALLILWGAYENAGSIVNGLRMVFGDGGGSARVSFSPAGGFSLEITETAVASASAVASSAQKSEAGPLTPSQIADVRRSALLAAYQLGTDQFNPRTRLKVLWVDDHPGNNIDLQFALQALGIIVICVDSNDVIEPAYKAASEFDVVVTDMYRDPSGRHEGDPEGGMKTIDEVKKLNTSTPVIIYAGSWARAHQADHMPYSGITITNRPQVVYETLLSLASKKAEAAH